MVFCRRPIMLPEGAVSAREVLVVRDQHEGQIGQRLPSATEMPLADHSSFLGIKRRSHDFQMPLPYPHLLDPVAGGIAKIQHLDARVEIVRENLIVWRFRDGIFSAVVPKGSAETIVAIAERVQ